MSSTRADLRAAAAKALHMWGEYGEALGEDTGVCTTRAKLADVMTTLQASLLADTDAERGEVLGGEWSVGGDGENSGRVLLRDGVETLLAADDLAAAEVIHLLRSK